MCVANVLVTTAVFMLLPYQMQLLEHFGHQQLESVLAVSLFAVGMFLPGPFNAHMVDAFSRKTVSQLSVLLFFVSCIIMEFSRLEWFFMLLRIFQGACFGTFQMSLGSALVNDLTFSEQRTSADYFYTWFGLFGLPFGIMTGHVVLIHFGPHVLFLAIVCSLLLAWMLLFLLRVPFRAPVKTPLLSTDRFLFIHSFVLMVNLFPVAMIPTMYLGCLQQVQPMLMMLYGLIGGLLVHRILFSHTDPRADAVSGLLMILTSSVMILNPAGYDFMKTAFLLMGVGVSWFCSRLLLYFLKLSGHCQRGTLQQTYILVLITGNCLGFFLGYVVPNVFILTIIVTVFSLFFYIFVAHKWFMRKNVRNFRFRET